MADFVKKPLGQSLNEIALKRAADAIALEGKNLPCRVVAIVSSGIVTVNFEVNFDPIQLQNVTVPIEYPEYIRYPIQIGDKGMVISADVRLGNISGLGAATPPGPDKPANLSALSFVWLGNTGWSAVEDTQAVVIYGPNGGILRTTDKVNSITVNSSGIQLTGNFAAFGGSPVSKETITGALSAVTDANAKAVLTSIIAALTGYTLATDGTT